ncbi:MAG TPA: FtsX-like permease family protein [Gemmatimonadaceae bacterium]|jgi:putative ABC transport system permease protein
MSLDAIRVAARTLRKQPAFAIVVILSLGMAIALNTTMYGVLDALLHPRVDLRDPGAVYRIKFFGDYKQRVTNATRDSLVTTAPSIESTAWLNEGSFVFPRLLRSGDQFAEAPVAQISREYFNLVGPRVITGRLFARSDVDDATQSIVLGEALASRLFAPGTNPLGKRVVVDNTPYVVIGVISRYADFPQQHAGFATFVSNPSGGWVLGKPGPHEMYARVVRVRPGVTRKILERDLALVADRITVAGGEIPPQAAFRLGGITQEQVQLAGVHIALITAVVAVLLVACANVANMQLARGIARGRELALRVALGANRRSLISYLLIESVVLACVGLILGLVLTYWFGVALRASIPSEVGRYIVEPSFSWRVLVFAMLATIACIVLVGLAPAVRVSSVDPNTMLKSGAGTGATRRHRRQYGFLVVVEIGIALSLLCACGVAIQSAVRVHASLFRSGYDPRPLAVGYLTTPLIKGERKALPELFASALDRLHTIKGAENSAVSTYGSFENGGMVIADSSGLRAITVLGFSYDRVSPGYFRVMGLPVIMGRDFRDGERDVAGVIIDEYTAKKYWPNANPVGALMKFGDQRSTRPFVRIVGVAGRYDANGDLKPINMADQSGATIGSIYYLPSEADSIDAKASSYPMSVVVRTTGDATVLATAMRRAGVFRAEPMTDMIGLTSARASEDFMATLFTLFAAMALGLGVFGVYGVVAHSVAERRREIGVRIALGATSRDILHTVLRETVVIGLSGLAFGLTLVMLFMSPLQSFAYAGDTHDSVLFSEIALCMFGVAGLSAFIPARRATLVDPTESLRSE